MAVRCSGTTRRTAVRYRTGGMRSMWSTYCSRSTTCSTRVSITPTRIGTPSGSLGLCYLPGYSFMPRLKDLKEQQLYPARPRDVVLRAQQPVPWRSTSPRSRTVGSACPGREVVEGSNHAGAHRARPSRSRVAVGSPGQGVDHARPHREHRLRAAVPSPIAARSRQASAKSTGRRT